MLNINFFGGPGTGKSTTSAGVFHEMKKNGYKVEYVSEYAKDLVYSKDFYKIKDQMMILAKQHHPWFKLEEQVDYTVNDGPFLLGSIYLQDSVHLPKKEFEDLLLKVWNSYKHINIFLERDNHEHAYQEYGRQQTLEQAEEIDYKIRDMLIKTDQAFWTVKVGPNAVQSVLDIVSRSKEIK